MRVIVQVTAKRGLDAACPNLVQPGQAGTWRGGPGPPGEPGEKAHRGPAPQRSSVLGVNPDLDYLDHLARESARFAEAVSAAPPDARVPTCPGWNADDLLWHLGEVQWFWGTIVRENADRRAGRRAQARAPGRPGRAGRTSTHRASSVPPARSSPRRRRTPPAWTWSDDQTVGFIRRRQAHEALIHRVDAELAGGQPHPAGPAAERRRRRRGAARHVRRRARLGHVHRRTTAGPCGSAPPTPGLLARHARPVHRHRPERDQLRRARHPRRRQRPGDRPPPRSPARAADLDCWLWHRPATGPVERSGDQDVLSRFESTIAPGID